MKDHCNCKKYEYDGFCDCPDETTGNKSASVTGLSCPMTADEIDCEVFKVVRAQQDRSKKAIMNILKQHLPELNNEQLGESLKRLAR